MHAGFYDLLYAGNTALYKKVSKTFNENFANAQGLNRYIVESNEYYWKKGDQYHKVKNIKSLLLLMNNKKKEVEQFMKTNRLTLRKEDEDTLKRVIIFYDEINRNSVETIN